MSEPPASGRSSIPPGAAPLIGAALGLGLVVAAAAMAFFLWLGDEVLEGETGAIDRLVRDLIHGAAGPAFTRLMVTASDAGAPRILSILAVVAAAGFLLRGWHRGAVLVLVTMVGAGVLDLVLKHFYGRPRPSPFFVFYPAPSSFSFPSGHTLFATCFFGGIAVLASHRMPGLATRMTLWFFALLAIGLIGGSRIYLGVHYPTDVLGGFAAGVVWVGAVALGDRLAGYRRARNG